MPIEPTEPSAQAAELSRSLGLGAPRTSRRLGWWLAALALAAGMAGLGFAYLETGGEEQVRYKTAEVRVGDLKVKVSATGKLEPITQVEVGTEVSGTIQAVEVDFNDRVKTGQVLARLDPDQSKAKYRQSEAALNLARARVQEAEATVTETGNKLRRTRDLIAKQLSSPEELDTVAAASERAAAALAVTKAQVAQAQAQLDADRRTLDKTEIRSPIDGIVLKRQVQPGQTVAASLQTPVLFTLAENLAQMELKVAVDEADVGQVAEGQAASFTVDAYPDRSFPATLTQVRYAPETVDGVVTYGTLLGLDNTDLSLRPGMTATAEILVREEHGAVLVPNAALRFNPPKPNASKGSSGLVGMLLPQRAPEPKRIPESSRRTAKAGKVWILRDGTPVAVEVRIGATDGVSTQVLDDTLAAGTQVLVDVERPAPKKP
jgi:HlyD family secretion protein